MSTYNLDEFKTPAKVNTRVAVKNAQTFELKYRDGTFTVAKPVWDKLDLDNKGLAVKVHPTSKFVALFAVDNEEAEILKRTEKTGVEKVKTFKAGVIENALASTGIINKTVHTAGVDSYSQYLKLVEVGNGYVIEKDETNGKGNGATASAPAEPATSTTQDEAVGTDQVPSSEDLFVDPNIAQSSAQSETSNAQEDEDFSEKF